jgi:hypothetical protein
LRSRKNCSCEAEDECAENKDFHLCLLIVDGQKVVGVTGKDNRPTETLYSLCRTEGFSAGTVGYPEMVGPLKCCPLKLWPTCYGLNLTRLRLEVSAGTPGSPEMSGPTEMWSTETVVSA